MFISESNAACASACAAGEASRGMGECGLLHCRASLGPSARFTSIIRYGPRDRTHCSVCDFLESPCVPSGRRHAWTPRYYFALPKSLTQSLIVGSVAFEEAGAHRTIPRTDARVRHGIAGGVGSRWQTVENRVPSWRRCCLYSQSPRPPTTFQAAKSWRGIQGCLRPDRTPDNSNFLQVNSTSSASRPSR